MVTIALHALWCLHWGTIILEIRLQFWIWQCIKHAPHQTRNTSRASTSGTQHIKEKAHLGPSASRTQDIKHATRRDDKDIKKQSRRKNAVGNMVVRKFYLYLLRQKSNCSSHIVTPIMDVPCGVIHTKTLLENLLSVIVTHSNILLKSIETPARVWHLRWTQLTISMWCTANLLTAWWAE